MRWEHAYLTISRDLAYTNITLQDSNLTQTSTHAMLSEPAYCSYVLLTVLG